jgi:hypothetical protein
LYIGQPVTITNVVSGGLGIPANAVIAGIGTDGKSFRISELLTGGGTGVVDLSFGAVTSALHTSPVKVNNGGTLGGTGSILGSAVTVAVGGTLAPGASIESLDMGSLDLQAGSTFDWEYSSGGGLPVDNAVVIGADVANVAGALSISTAALLSGVDLGTSALAHGTRLTFISYGGSLATGPGFGHFAGVPEGWSIVLGGQSFRVNYDDTPVGTVNELSAAYGNAVVLTAVPEASSIVVLGLAGAFAMGAAWFGKRRGFTV